MKDEQLGSVWPRGLEAALVAGGCGVKIIWAFRQVLLLGLVVFLDEEMAALDGNGEYLPRGKLVSAGNAAQFGGGELDGLVLLELGQGWKAVVRRVVFPVEGKERWAKK